MTVDRPNRSHGGAQRNLWDDNPDFDIHFVASPKRVRAMSGGETVADSTRVMLLREPDHLPVYYFPVDDVRMDLLTPTTHQTHCPWKGSCSYFTVSVGGHTVENAAWTYAEPYPQVSFLRDHIAFYWDRMDSWYEEDEEVFVHARDPMHRVDAIRSHRAVRAALAGVEIARSTKAMFVFETGLPTRYYIPHEDVRMDLMTASPTRTSCPYKGDAIYYHAFIGDQRFEDVAWSYPSPIAEMPRIAGLVAFFSERAAQISVDGVLLPKVKTPWSQDRDSDE